MTRGSDWRLGACPSAADLVAWRDGTLDDWDLGEHVLTCPSCVSDLAALDAGEELVEPELAPDGSLDLGMLGEPLPPAKELARPTPGSLWVVRAIRPHAPMNRVIVLGVDGDTAQVGLLLPAEDRIPHDVDVDHELPLVAAAGVIEALSLDDLAGEFGRVDATTVVEVAAAVHVEPDDEGLGRARAWDTLRFVRVAHALCPPVDDLVDAAELAPPEALIASLAIPRLRLRAQVGGSMGPTASAAHRTARQLDKALAEHEVPLLAQAGWCEPTLVLQLAIEANAPIATGSVTLRSIRDGIHRFDVRINEPSLTWEGDEPSIALRPDRQRARFTAAATIQTLDFRIELVEP